MSILTLFNTHGALISTDQLVFTTDEIEPACDLIESISKIKKMLATATTEITEQEKTAREKGFKEGLKRGRHFARIKTSRALLALESERRQLHTIQQKNSATLAIDIVRKIGLTEPTPDCLLALAVKSSEELKANEKAILCVHPDQMDDVTSRLKNVKDIDWLWRVEADDTLEPDDCQLKTAHGVLRIGLESQLRMIERSLHESSDS